VRYPGLESHPQHALAKQQQKAAGGLLAFELDGGREEAWRFIDATDMVSTTANLGDTKTLITHPASTTHYRMPPEARAQVGITESLVRIAVGLEDIEDIKRDLQRGFDAIR
jgi:O-succinylhomoserine sulfhydrylase